MSWTDGFPDFVGVNVAWFRRCRGGVFLFRFLYLYILFLMWKHISGQSLQIPSVERSLAFGIALVTGLVIDGRR